MRIHVLIIAAALPLSPLAYRASHTPRAEPRELCRIGTSGAATGSRADICAQVARRWSLLFAEHAPPGVIRLTQRVGFEGHTDAGQWTLEWGEARATSASTAALSRDGIARHYADNIIPHEAGHEVFGAYLELLHFPATATGYASAAPDWFDEAPAIWMESQTERERRVHGVVGTTPSLARLITMENSASADIRSSRFGADFQVHQQTVVPPCPKCTFWPESLRTRYRITAVGVHADGRADTLTQFSTTDPQSASLEEREFYPLAYALLRFIRTRGGTAAVRMIVDRYRANPRAREEVLEGLPGLPRKFPAFERAWRTFLKSAPPDER